MLVSCCCCCRPLSIFSMLLSSTEAEVVELELGDGTWRGRDGGGDEEADVGGGGVDCLLLTAGGGATASSLDAGLLSGREGETCGGDRLGGEPQALALLGVTVSNADPVGDSAPTDTAPW